MRPSRFATWVRPSPRRRGPSASPRSRHCPPARRPQMRPPTCFSPAWPRRRAAPALRPQGGKDGMSDDRSVFDATASQATRDKRQQLGQQVVMAISSVLRNARSYSEDNAVFIPVLDAVQHAIFALLESDGAFELDLIDDGIYLNR